MELNQEILQEFKELTGFDVLSLFEDYVRFFDTDYPNLVAFYNGTAEKYNPDINKRLAQLKSDVSDVFSTFNEFGEYLNNIKWWNLMDELENMNLELNTADNLPKWLRSSTSRSVFSNREQTTTNLKQFQTLESLNRDLGVDDWNNQWIQTAYNNNLDEEDYTPENQVMLKVFLSRSGSIRVLSIVDEIIDRNILGKDLQRKFEFRDNDLVALSPTDTFEQTAEILVQLRKGDNPSSPSQGINPKLVVGSNIASLSYPVVIRNMIDTFATDDSIKSFSLLDIKREQDGVFFSFQVESRLGDLQNIVTSFSN